MDSPPKKRVLFVDDETMILDALKRMLRPYRDEWEMLFAASGREALEMMKIKPMDIVVSDMRMPEMDGLTLLTEVMRLYPETIRFILSGQSEKSAVLRAVNITHQFLSKPCEAETIKRGIERALKLRSLLKDEKLKSLVSGIKSLPSLPELYVQLEEEIRSKSCSMERIGRIVEKDVSMSVKVLQLVNSSFFGLRQHVSSPSQAVSLLGIDIVHSLALVSGIFSSTKDSSITAFSLKSLWEHSLTTGAKAKRIVAEMGKKDKTLEDEALKAGIFHDLGKLVLALSFPVLYRKTVLTAESKKISHVSAEYYLLETSHAEVGAYLLGLWGFSDVILEAVAYHHLPGHCLAAGFHPVAAVHAADALDHQEHAYDALPPGASLDMEYFEKENLRSSIPGWRKLCEEKK
jgi:HD-like signal output (HDOD) protein/CheY-like chemotaxis protein